MFQVNSVQKDCVFPVRSSLWTVLGWKCPVSWPLPALDPRLTGAFPPLNFRSALLPSCHNCEFSLGRYGEVLGLPWYSGANLRNQDIIHVRISMCSILQIEMLTHSEEQAAPVQCTAQLCLIMISAFLYHNVKSSVYG